MNIKITIGQYDYGIRLWFKPRERTKKLWKKLKDFTVGQKPRKNKKTNVNI